QAVHRGAVPRVVPSGLRVAQEAEQRVTELKFHVVVQPSHDTYPEAFESEPRREGTARTADAELVLRDELRGRTEVDQQRVFPDGERYVVRRRRGLLDLEVERQVENRVHDQDRIEARRLGVERRVTGEVWMVVQKLDDPERNRDRHLGLPVSVGPRVYGAIGRVVPLEASGAAEAQAPHADAARR